MVPVVLAVAAVAVWQSSPAADSLLVRAATLPESALIVEARDRPQDLRDALAGALARTARSKSAPVSRDADLATARRLASAYALAWSDSFLVREVERFAAWPAERRAGKAWADSVRREGVRAYSRRGTLAAIALWRRAYRRSLAIADTAGMAASLGNIGAGFLNEDRLDSANTYLQRTVSLARSVGDLRVRANATVSLAEVARSRGQVAAARARYAEALALHERIGDSRGMASTYNNLGLLAQDGGDLVEARRQFEAALELNRRTGRDDVAATNLVNLAGLASLAGEFGTAERLYRDALATWRSREMWADAAEALRGLGQLEMRRGNYRAAHEVFREARTLFDRAGPSTESIAVREELSRALAAMGELQQAREELAAAERLTGAAQAGPAVHARLTLARAELAVQVNALAEAEPLFTRAEFLYRRGGDAEGEAEARRGRAALLLERGELPQAQALLESSWRALRLAGDQRAAALTRLPLAEVAAARGDTTGARRHLTRAIAELARVNDPVARAAALGEYAGLEARAGFRQAAESLYRAGLDRLRDRPAPQVSWSLRAGLAAVYRASGDHDDAARELQAAIAELEELRASLRLPERRSGFLADKWDVYLELALTEHRRGRPGAAFAASERLRGRAMLDLLSRSRVGAPGDTAADLVTREQDLRRYIGELTGTLSEPAIGARRRGPTLERSIAGARDNLRRAQDAYAALMLEIGERAPAHASLVSAPTADWRSVAARLAPDEAFVEYLTGDSTSLAFVIRHDTIAVIDLEVRRRDLARLVEFARGTLQPRGTPRLDSLWRGPLRRLHGQLVAPLEDAELFAGISRLVVVPHAELHYLPFAALVDGERNDRFLIERFELVTAPSASVWLALGVRRASPPPAGILVLAPRTEALPGTQQEVRAIARLRDARALDGSAATEEAFRREAPGRRIVHLASYGVLNQENPLFSFVELGPGGGHDGRLEVHEVFGLRLTADLVVLSACQTGLGSGLLADVPAGDDWVSLSRAFLHAGAARVMATLWPVEDWATAALIDRFYRALGQARPGDALAAAQRSLLADAATAHPYYWAGVLLVEGNAGRTAGR
jgi:CHAT domain-containing protein/Tfp pilus assembly protein PilF